MEDYRVNLKKTGLVCKQIVEFGMTVTIKHTLGTIVYGGVPALTPIIKRRINEPKGYFKKPT